MLIAKANMISMALTQAVYVEVGYFKFVGQSLRGKFRMASCLKQRGGSEDDGFGFCAALRSE